MVETIIDNIKYKVETLKGKTLLENNGLVFERLPDGSLALYYVSSECLGCDCIILPAACSTIQFKAFESIKESLVTVCGLGVRSVMSSAFDSCKKLRYVRLGRLKYIGSNAFNKCLSLEYMPDLSHIENLEDLGSEAFSQCKLIGYMDENGNKIDGHIFIPKNIKYINNVFYRSNVKSVIFEDGGSYVIKDGFRACGSLTYCNLFDKNAELKNTKAQLQFAAFKGIRMRDLYIRDWCTLEGNAFESSRAKSIHVNAKEIPKACFKDNKLLTDVVLGDECKKICALGFSHCESLKEINFNKVELVENDALEYSGITHYSGNPVLNKGAFAWNRLESVEINNDVNGPCFEHNPDLTDVKVNVPFSNIKDKSLPVSVLRNHPEIDYRKLYCEYSFFLAYDGQSIRNEDVLNDIKKKLKKYKGGYYVGSDANPYACLMFYDGDGVDLSKNPKVDIHPDCDTFSIYNFANKLLLKEGTPLILSLDKKYKGQYQYKAYDAVNQIHFMNEESMDFSDFNEIPHVNVVSYDNSIKKISNPFIFVKQGGVVILPEKLDDLIANQTSMNLYVVLPKELNCDYSAGKELDFEYKTSNISFVVRPGTNPDVVKKMEDILLAHPKQILEYSSIYENKILK